MKFYHPKPQTKRVFKAIIYILATFLLVAVAVVVGAGIIPPAIPVTPAGLKQTYSVYVPMKDGTRIAVRISLPPDLRTDERIPAIVETTRYLTEAKSTFLLNVILNLRLGRKAPDEIKNSLLKQGYAVVKVDARGSGASFGNRDMEWSKEEIEDTGQVIDWLVKQPWSDGKVGTYGISYSGNTAELALRLNHPAIKASAPLYADFDPMAHSAMPGGLFNIYLLQNWAEAMAVFDANTIKGWLGDGIAPVDEDEDEQLLNQALRQRHNIDVLPAFAGITYFDNNLTAQYPAYALDPYYYKTDIQHSGVPLYVRVGWLDAGTVNGAIERFLTYSNNQQLVIGPWNHGGNQFYDPFLETNVSRMSLEQEQGQAVAAFFDQYLRTEGPIPPKKKELVYYTMGEGVWKTSPVWPVAGFNSTPFYLNPDGRLSLDRPENSTGATLYTVDFSATTGENNRWRTNLGGGPIIYADRAAADDKLLTYTSPPLETDVEITGTPTVTLYLSSSAADGAFYVYLEDVSPQGQVTYITEGQLRALHRALTIVDVGKVALPPSHSFMSKDGAEMVPGRNVELNIGMFATSVLLPKGHRIRLAIAGHDAANFARVPVDVTPTIEVQANRSFLSRLELPLKSR